VRLIDLHHQGYERVIGSYLFDTADGPALQDCGPSTTIPALKAGLAAHGLELQDVRHLLLSHIHFDHAGATGPLVREHPGLQVHVSAVGAPHLIDPTRLESSARRLYGDTFDTLWGELAPVPEENVHVVGDRVLGFECFPSPGHASHHVCYLDPAEGTLLAGDAVGVRIQPASFVLPPTPPPDIDLEAWERTLREIERRDPQRLALIHFGVAHDVGRHLAELRERLARWGTWVRGGMSSEEFVAAAESELPHDELGLYEHAVPPWQCYLGLRRYWDKKLDAAPRS
jgi:glyoxylase-like metal-dependent hydrolase (beta-lactamase superfamily II)